MKELVVKIKASYSFWRHPIQWIKEYKMRRVMEDLFEWDWNNNGGKEKFLKEMSKVVGSNGIS